MKIKNILQIFIFLQFLSVPFIATAQNHEHYNPDIVVDAVGNSYVTWLAENDGSTTSGRIMVQKFNAAGTRQWSSDLQVSSKSLTWSSGDWQPTPKIDTDGTYVYVIWNRRNTEVAMQKIDANGILQWTEEKVVSVNEPPESIGNDLAVSDDGFIYINFQRYGPFGWASFLQKIDSDGNPQFANDIASGQGSNQTRPQIAISGNDIIYTMNNSTNGGPWLRRMDSAGNTIWHSIDLDQTTSIAVDSSGNPVSSGRSGDQIIVKKYDQNGAQVGGDIIVSSGVDNPERVHHYIDENDNIYVTWIADVTNATNKVFAQKIDSNGVRQWANDVEISVGEFTHLPDPRIYADGQGGANVVWYHGASGGGGYTIFMNGADAAGNRKYALSVIVNADGPPGGGSNQPPVFTSSPVTVFYVDVQNFYQVTATDINNNTITYSVTQGPTGYGINPLTGLVSWNPSGASVGVHPITIQADDNRGGITEQSFDLMVIYSIAQMVSPTNGSQITGNSIDFQWTAGAGILEYWLYVSTTPSGNNVYTKSQGLNTSVTVPNITLNGNPLYVRLWSKTYSGWQYMDYIYQTIDQTQGGNNLAEITSPAPGSTLQNSSVTFQWTTGTNIYKYWLHIGTSPGTSNVYSQSQGTNTSVTVNGLTLNGNPLYVRLWSQKGSGAWEFLDYIYQTTDETQTGTSLAEMATPVPGTTLQNSSVTFQWNPGVGAFKYWLHVGTTPGSSNLYSQLQGTNTSVTVSNIPLNGNPLYVRLWSSMPNGWQYIDYIYQTIDETQTGTSLAEMATPVPGTTLQNSSVTFQWSPGVGAFKYWLHVGTTPGGSNIYTQSQGLNTSVTVPNIPINGNPLYVRLWSSMTTDWEFIDYIYQTTGPAELVSPSAGTVLNNSTVTFTWSTNSLVTEHQLYIGTSSGAQDIYSQSLGLGTSATVNGIPLTGQKIYVQLWSKINNTWIIRDYMFDTIVVDPVAFNKVIPEDSWFLSEPHGIVFDGTSGLYVTDRNNVKKFDLSGNHLFTIGDRGTEDGNFVFPDDVDIDSQGNIYVADTSNNRIQKFDSNGNFLTSWTIAQPESIAIDSQNIIYVLDGGTDHNIKKYDPAGNFLGEWGNDIRAAHLAVDSQNFIYIADNDMIHKYDGSGTLLDQWGESGITEDWQLSQIEDIVIDQNDILYIASNWWIQKFELNGNFLSKTENGNTVGLRGIAVDQNGIVYVTQNNFDRVSIFDNTGNYLDQFGDGQFIFPSVIAIDTQDFIYVGENEVAGNLTVQRFQKIDTNGNPLAKINTALNGLAIDSSGFIYKSKAFSSPAVPPSTPPTCKSFIEKLDSAGNVVGKWGDNCGSANGEFRTPTDIGIDSQGFIYVVDQGNNRIQKFSSNGNFILKWGSGGSGAGQFDKPSGIAFDHNGGVYVTDENNDRVQKFNSSGNFVREWGTSGSGDGQFNEPRGIAADSNNFIYVVDRNNHRIEQFDNDGNFLYKWGTQGSLPEEFDSPIDIGIDSQDNIYIADPENHRIQKYQKL